MVKCQDAMCSGDILDTIKLNNDLLINQSKGGIINHSQPSDHRDFEMKGGAVVFPTIDTQLFVLCHAWITNKSLNHFTLMCCFFNNFRIDF